MSSPVQRKQQAADTEGAKQESHQQRVMQGLPWQSFMGAGKFEISTKR